MSLKHLAVNKEGKDELMTRKMQVTITLSNANRNSNCIIDLNYHGAL